MVAAAAGSAEVSEQRRSVINGSTETESVAYAPAARRSSAARRSASWAGLM